MSLLPVDQNTSEKDFQAELIKLAEANGWLYYHTHDSRRSQAGFPDLIMIKGAYLLVAELKSLKGKMTPEQDLWLESFGNTRTLSVRRWKPGIHNEEIIDVLTDRGKGEPVDEFEELRVRMLHGCEHGYMTYECKICMKKIVDGMGE